MFSKLISAVAVALTIKDVSGSGCSPGPVLQSSKLRFGDGEGSSVCGGLAISTRSLQQPFLQLGGEWTKLTYDVKPMEAAISVGGELQESCLGFDSTDESGFIVEDSEGEITFGYGTITGTKQCTVGETTLVLTQSFTLAKADSASLTSALTVSATGADAANVEFWWGTGDDFIAGSDFTYKEVGTLGSDGFDAAEQGNAVLVTSGTDDDAVGVSFGSPSPGARALHARCCQFSNIYTLDPETKFTGKVNNDGSYGVYLPLGTIKAGEAASASAFYSAAKVAELEAALEEAASAAAPPPSASPSPPSPPPPPPSTPPMCATECGIFSNGADKYKGDSLCRRNEPEYRAGYPVYRCSPPTRYPAPLCDAGYSLCKNARACKEKKKCGRKIANCAKKVRKKPGKWHKCLKKWGKNADGSCTNLKMQRKCPASCGVCG